MSSRATLRQVTLAAMSIAGSAAACSEDGDGVQRVVPILLLEPDRVAFGEVPVGATRHAVLRAKNVGSAELIITPPVAAEGATFFSGSRETRLDPGKEADIDVAFRPASMEPAEATLVFTTNTDEPSVEVKLSGRGIEGVLDISPAEVDLTGTPLGANLVARLSVSNRGPAALQAKLVASFPRPEHFALSRLERDLAPATVDVPAMGGIPLSLEYHPIAGGIDFGFVQLETCGPGCGPEVRVRASTEGDLGVDPPSVDFGAIGVGAMKMLSVTVKNRGGHALRLATVNVAGSTHVVASLQPPFDGSLAPGAQGTIELRYWPDTEGTLEAELILSTDTPGSLPLRVPLRGSAEAARISVRPEAIEFGILTQPVTTRRGFQMTNVGSGEVNVRSITLRGDPAFSLTDVPGLPSTLGRGESISSYVSFTPMGERSYDAEIEIASDDANHPIVRVPVHATLGTPRCRIDSNPTRIDFGLQVLNETESMPVVITNRGVEPCVLTASRFVGAGEPSFATSGVTWPLTLVPGGSITATVAFTPADLGETKAVLAISTDDPLLPELRVAVRGEGAPLCNGPSDRCACPRNLTKTYNRFFTALSAIFAYGQAFPFHISCEQRACQPREVAVQKGVLEFICTPHPASCPAGLEPQYTDEWNCSPCPLIVQFGSIYDGQRACATEPTLTCGPGETPTFRIETLRWECMPTCDNTLYDQINREGLVLCVPC